MNIEFYEKYYFPKHPQHITQSARKKLLELIKIPGRYIENSSDNSVRIHINTPVLRNEGKVGKITVGENTCRGSRLTVNRFPLIREKKENSKSPLELEKLTVSGKKLQKGAKAVGLELNKRVPSTLKLNSLLTSTEPHQTLLLSNRKIQVVAKKEERKKKAVKFLMDIAKTRGDMLRGVDWVPVSRKSTTASIQKALEANQSFRAANDRSASLTDNELNPFNEVKKKIRRHTVSVIEYRSSFIGALEQLALAPIQSSV